MRYFLTKNGLEVITESIVELCNLFVITNETGRPSDFEDIFSVLLDHENVLFKHPFLSEDDIIDIAKEKNSVITDLYAGEVLADKKQTQHTIIIVCCVYAKSHPKYISDYLRADLSYVNMSNISMSTLLRQHTIDNILLNL